MASGTSVHLRPTITSTDEDMGTQALVQEIALLTKIFPPGVQPMTGLKHYTRTYCTAAGYGDGLWTLCLYSTERDFVNTSWSLPLLR